MSAIAAGLVCWESQHHLQQNHRIQCFDLPVFDQNFTAGLEINFRRTGAAEPHQTSTPAAAVLPPAQSKTTFAGIKVIKSSTSKDLFCAHFLTQMGEVNQCKDYFAK